MQITPGKGISPQSVSVGSRLSPWGKRACKGGETGFVKPGIYFWQIPIIVSLQTLNSNSFNESSPIIKILQRDQYF